MRVITGTARGRNLETVEGLDVRPTTSKVKEGIFSAIQFEIEGARVLDLFCGSGQLGIEALSRGASFCVFVDSARRSQDVTKRNLMATGLFSSARVAAMDYKDFLRTTKERFDIVFLDPPYSKGLAQEAMKMLVDIMTDSGVILCEHEVGDEIDEEIGDFVRVRQYRYGRVLVSAYRKKQ